MIAIGSLDFNFLVEINLVFRIEATTSEQLSQNQNPCRCRVVRASPSQKSLRISAFLILDAWFWGSTIPGVEQVTELVAEESFGKVLPSRSDSCARNEPPTLDAKRAKRVSRANHFRANGWACAAGSLGERFGESRCGEAPLTLGDKGMTRLNEPVLVGVPNKGPHTNWMVHTGLFPNFCCEPAS